jgi:hypothetical protein
VIHIAEFGHKLGKGGGLGYIQTCKILCIGGIKGKPQENKLIIKVVFTRLSQMQPA